MTAMLHGATFCDLSTFVSPVGGARRSTQAEFAVALAPSIELAGPPPLQCPDNIAEYKPLFALNDQDVTGGCARNAAMTLQEWCAYKICRGPVVKLSWPFSYALARLPNLTDFTIGSTISGGMLQAQTTGSCADSVWPVSELMTHRWNAFQQYPPPAAWADAPKHKVSKWSTFNPSRNALLNALAAGYFVGVGHGNHATALAMYDQTFVYAFDSMLAAVGGIRAYFIDDILAVGFDWTLCELVDIGGAGPGPIFPPPPPPRNTVTIPSVQAKAAALRVGGITGAVKANIIADCNALEVDAVSIDDPPVPGPSPGPVIPPGASPDGTVLTMTSAGAINDGVRLWTFDQGDDDPYTKRVLRDGQRYLPEQMKAASIVWKGGALKIQQLSGKWLLGTTVGNTTTWTQSTAP